MKRESLKIKRFFLLLQVAILLGTFLVFIALVSRGYIFRVRQESRVRLNSAINLTIDNIMRSEDIPEKLIEPYVFFILNQKDGSYVRERKDKSEQSSILWEQYRTKLTYQMQRQKRGWISYPKENVWKFFKSSRIIRYAVVEPQDWIVVFEDTMPSNWKLLQDIVNKKLFADLIFVIALGFILFKIITDRYFDKIERHIADSFDGSMLDFNHAISKKKMSSTVALKETVKSKPLESYFDTTNEIKEAEPEDVQKDNDLEGHIDHGTSNKIKKGVLGESKPEIILKQTNGLIADEKESLNDYKQKTRKEMPSPDKLEYESGNWTVSVQGIKSPALKKMLKELREQKEKT